VLADTAAVLRETPERVRFFVMVNHGVPQPLIDATFPQARRFHDQPMDAKIALKLPWAIGHEGLEVVKSGASHPRSLSIWDWIRVRMCAPTLDRDAGDGQVRALLDNRTGDALDVALTAGAVRSV
jgi:hypothetical protein